MRVSEAEGQCAPRRARSATSTVVPRVSQTDGQKYFSLLVLVPLLQLSVI